MDINLIKIEVGNISFKLPEKLRFGGRVNREAHEASVYGGALSNKELRRVYEDPNLYSHLEFCGYRLPYTVEALFFDKTSEKYVPHDSLRCFYQPDQDVQILPKNHPLADSSLKSQLQKAYTRRKWKNKDIWGDPSAGVSSRPLLRIAEISRDARRIEFARTDYDTQAVTNLVPDLEVREKTIRRMTFQNRCLPALSDKRLANNLGISILFLDRDGRPMLPLRAGQGVAIFPDEWGCTVSFAADFPDNVEPGQEWTISEMIATALGRQLRNEIDALLGTLDIVPLALCREWFRAGKPQLFMAVQSPYQLHEIQQRLKEAPHSDEVASTLWPIIGKKKIWSPGNTDQVFSIEALANWGLYALMNTIQAR